MSDGSIRINLELANDHLKVGLKEIERMVKSSSNGIKNAFEKIGDSSDLKSMTQNLKKGINEAGKGASLLQKQLDSINSNKSVKAVQKMIDTANKEIDKAKSKVDEYQKKLDSIDAQKEIISLQATKDSRIGMNDTDENIEKRVQKLLDQNKEYQKLLAQEQQMVDKIEQYETNISSAESKVKILNDTLTNTKENMSIDLSSGIEKSSQNMDVLNDKYKQAVQLQEEINQVNSSLKDEQFLSKIKDEEQYNQLLQETLDKMSLIENESEKAANLNGLNYDDLIQGNELYQQMYHQLTLLINNQDRYNAGISSGETRLQQIVNTMSSGISASNGMFRNITQVFKNVKTLAGQLASSVKQKFNSVKKSISSLFAPLVQLGSGIKSVLNKMGLFKGSASNMANSFGRSLKRMVLGVFGLRSAFMAVRKIMNSYLESHQDIANQINSIWASLANALSPIIEGIVNLAIELISYFASLIKVFTGMDILAKKANNTAKSTDKTTKAQKEYNKTLAAFDEVNTLGKEDSKDSSGDNGNGNKTPTTYKWADVDTSWIEGLKKAFEEGWYETGLYLGESLNKVLEGIDWEKIKKKAENIGTNIAKFLNGAIEGIDWTLLGKTLGEGINTAINFCYGLVSTFDFKKFGKSLAEFISSAIKTIDWKKLAETLSNGIKGMFGFITGFFENLDTDAIAEAFVNFISGIDWVGIIVSGIQAAISVAGAFAKLAISLVNSIGKAIVETDWGKVAQNIWNGICSAFNSLKETVISIGVKLAQTASQLWDWFSKGGFSKWAIKIGNTLKSGADALWKAFKGTGFGKWTIKIANSLKKKASELWKAFKGSGFGKWTIKIVNKLANSAKKLWEQLQKDWNKIKNKVLGGLTVKNGKISIGGKSYTPEQWVNMNQRKAKGGIFTGGQWRPIAQYASGGFVKSAQIFMAREAGPELVGTIGSHSAVMNNTQIVSSVADGVARAVSSIINKFKGFNFDISVSLDSKAVSDSISGYLGTSLKSSDINWLQKGGIVYNPRPVVTGYENSTLSSQNESTQFDKILEILTTILTFIKDDKTIVVNIDGEPFYQWIKKRHRKEIILNNG